MSLIRFLPRFNEEEKKKSSRKIPRSIGFSGERVFLADDERMLRYDLGREKNGVIPKVETDVFGNLWQLGRLESDSVSLIMFSNFIIS